MFILPGKIWQNIKTVIKPSIGEILIFKTIEYNSGQFNFTTHWGMQHTLLSFCSLFKLFI